MKTIWILWPANCSTAAESSPAWTVPKTWHLVPLSAALSLGNRWTLSLPAKSSKSSQHQQNTSMAKSVEAYHTDENFGAGCDNLPNAIYFSGDTVYIPELARMAGNYHICAAIMNLGNAHVVEDITNPESSVFQITMDGRSAARLLREIKADVLVPMYYESWGHFTQFGDELRQAFKCQGI